MIPIRDSYVICCSFDKGPIFGGSHDLFIADSCNKNKESCAYFPRNYNNLENPYQSDSQASWKAFSGATSGSHFKVEEYEVFYVSGMKWPKVYMP